MTPGPLATTAIGSLPHAELEPALAAAFATDVPCLPTLPRRSAAELLVPQGLSGLPGLSFDASGNCTVEPDAWRQGRLDFQKSLRRAIDDPGQPTPIVALAEVIAAWPRFLEELGIRRAPLAKVQLVGPMTATRCAFLSDGRPLTSDLSIANQVFQLLMARALAMVQALQTLGTRPVFFFDEPRLSGLALAAARNLMALQELRTSVLALRRKGALVGLHCCGDAQWERLLPLGFNFISFDAEQSLPSVLRRRAELAAFAANGGRLVLGALPTDPNAHHREPQAVGEGIWQAFADAGCLGLLRSALLTPACGLGAGTVAEAENVLAALPALQSALARCVALA